MFDIFTIENLNFAFGKLTCENSSKLFSWNCMYFYKGINEKLYLFTK